MITWSNNWVSDCESLWSILAKFKIANEVCSNYIQKEFVKSNQPTLNNPLDKFLPDNFDYHSFSEQTGLFLIHYFQFQSDCWGLSNVNTNAIKELSTENLRYCPICIKDGFHSYLHQLKYIHSCPFHQTTYLIENCENCNLPINLYSSTFDYPTYQCKCGKELAETTDFGTIKEFWKQTAKQTFRESLFPEKQFIILHKPFGKTFSTNSNCQPFKINCSYWIENGPKTNYKKRIVDILGVYKCFLRRKRKACPKKCIKKHYRQGLAADLCYQCKAYIKLRGQFEIINNEWDLYFRNGGIVLKSYACISLDTITLVKLTTHLELIHISDLAFFNIQMYALYHSLKMNFANWVNYTTNKQFLKDPILFFSVITTDKNTLKLNIQY
ncbi:hypothetical protein VYF65_002991 [Lysinibacillus irui]|uniref:hypothetical protein n=1 Tax=Lysinibacillus irui TaxID=2998077 RepID=UPI003889EB17